MLFDSHFHLDSDFGSMPATLKLRGCLISRSPRTNYCCIELAAKYRFACAVFVGGDSAACAQLIVNNGVVAYKHMELTSRRSPQRDSPIFEASVRNNVPLVLHVNHHSRKRVHARSVARYLDYIQDHYPTLKIILAHMGAENCGLAVRFAKANPNIYLETSCLDETTEKLGFSTLSDTLRFVADNTSCNRILFGSDLPDVRDRGECREYAAVCEVFRSVERERVLGDNAAALFEHDNMAQIRESA